jgi:restriction endonuclease S subunit
MKSKIPSDMQPSLRLSDLSDTWLFLPSASEQARIVEQLSIQEDSFKAMDAALEASISKLEELKSSLITSVVTGLQDISTRRSIAS